MSGIILTHQPTDCMTSTLMLTRPASGQFIKYLYKAGKDQDSLCPVLQVVISLLCFEVVSSSLLFAAALVDSVLNIAQIPIKPLCTIKFKAIIHNMPEIAVLTVPVPLNQRSDEREV